MKLCSPHPLHFWNENRWTEINLKPEETDTGYILETTYYKFELIKFPFKISFNDEWVRGLDKPKTDYCSITDKGIEIKDIFKDMDMLIKFFPQTVMVFLRFKEGKYELNWKNQSGDFTEVHNYDVPMTVKSMHFGEKLRFEYPETRIEGTEEFRKYIKSDHFEDLPCLEIYYVH